MLHNLCSFGTGYILTLFVLHCVIMFCLTKPKQTQHINPDLFPAPTDPLFTRQCGADYLSKPFICDPDGLLSKTEADSLADLHFVAPGKFSSCWDERRVLTYQTGEVVFDAALALAKVNQEANLASNVSNTMSRSQHLSYETVTENLRRKWSTAHCEIDVMLLCLQTNSNNNYKRKMREPPTTPRETIASKSWSSSFPKRLQHDTLFRDIVIYVAVSSHVRKYMTNQDYKSVQKWPTSKAPASNTVHHCSDLIVSTLSLISNAIPGGTNRTTSIVESLGPDTPSSLSVADSHHRSIVPPGIPYWAVAVFCTCIVVSLLCAFLGYVVNRASSMVKRRSEFSEQKSNSAAVARTYRSRRRWRAGFGGGIYEVPGSKGAMAGAAPCSKQRPAAATIFRTVSIRNQPSRGASDKRI